MSLEQYAIKLLNVGLKSDGTDWFWDNILSIWEDVCEFQWL